MPHEESAQPVAATTGSVNAVADEYPMNSKKTPASSRRAYNVLLAAASLLFPSTTPHAAETLSLLNAERCLSDAVVISALIDAHDAR